MLAVPAFWQLLSYMGGILILTGKVSNPAYLDVL